MNFWHITKHELILQRSEEKAEMCNFNEEQIMLKQARKGKGIALYTKNASSEAQAQMQNNAI